MGTLSAVRFSILALWAGLLGVPGLTASERASSPAGTASAPIVQAAAAVDLSRGALAAGSIQAGGSWGDAPRPRLLVLTDIGGDPDDQQSMIRLMLYANEFEIEGLVASASGIPGELKQKITQPQLIRQIVSAYGQVRPRLVRHADGYPTAEHLLERVKAGNPHRGLEAIGPDGDTEGSRWIVQAADRPDARPLNISIWGGQTDLAQALWRVRRDRPGAGLEAFIRKLRIYDVGDQDGIAEWIRREFPGLFYVLGQAPADRDKREAVYRGMYLGGDESLVSREWMESHIRQGHGPLGALYPPRTWTAPNPHSAMKEGDTPSWFFFLANGLSDAAHPTWGGWGGRFIQNSAYTYRDARDTVGTVTDARSTVWRWRAQFQNDFAARLEWCVADTLATANHAPLAVLNGDPTRGVLRLAAPPGQPVQLSAAGTSDPDGNALDYRWWIYPEPSTLPDGLGGVRLSRTNGLGTSISLASGAKPASVHVILEVCDNGTPTLWACRRAVIDFAPAVSDRAAPSAPAAASTALPLVFELDLDQTREVRVDGPSGPVPRTLRLRAVRESYWPNYHLANLPEHRVFRAAEVEVDVSGTPATLRAQALEPPRSVNGLRLYVETTRGWATTTQLDPMTNVHGAVRFSCVAEGAPWGPADLRFPLRDYRWRANTYGNTWLALVPYNLHYYHRGEDFGAIPDRLDVLASLGGIVTRTPLPTGDGDSNGIEIRCPSGLELHYYHMNVETLSPRLTRNAAIPTGDPLGRTGMTWAGRKSQHSDPHLHWSISTQGEILASYPFLLEAYLRDYPDPLLAVAGGYHYATPGQTVEFDASRSVARPGRRIARYQWRLHDGRVVDGPRAELAATEPGLFSEELRLFADDGSEDRDYAQLRVWNTNSPPRFASGWFYHWPVRGAQPGTPVLFWNRLSGTTHPVEIDYGDGSPPERIEQEARHAYDKPGLYTVALRSRGPDEEPVEVRLRVVVDAKAR